MSRLKSTIRAALIALCAGAPAAVGANGIAGDYLAARQAAFLGDFEAAARYFGRALVYDPQNPQLLERAVLANVSLGDIEEAARRGDRMAELDLRSQLAQMATVTRDAKDENYAAVIAAIDDDRGAGPLADGLIRAWAQLGQGDMSGALVGFDEVAENQEGLTAFANYHKALALASVGDYDSAEAIFASGAAGGMGMTRRGAIARVQMLSQLGRFDEARTLIEDLFGRDLDPALATMDAALADGTALPFDHVRSPRDGAAEVFYTVAGALSNERNDDLTLVYARLAQYLRPGHVDATLLAAEVLEDLDQLDLAVEAYAEIPEDSEAFHAAAIGQASVLRRQERFEDAVEILQTLTETHGDLPSTHSALADTYRQMERFAEASEAYTTALDLVEEVGARQWFLYYARGITYEREGAWEQAEADFRRALELNPGQPQVLNYLGYSLVEKRMKLDEALGMIEQAVEAQPESGYIVDSLGWALYRLGRYDEAVGHMERAAELMPIDPVVNDHLGDVYWAVGRELEAEFQWRRALSFLDWQQTSEEVDAERIRRKLEVGLDAVLEEEGARPLAQKAAEARASDDG